LLVIDRIFFGFPFGNMVDTNINGGSADTNGNGGRGVTNPCGEHGEEDWTDELVMAPTPMGLGFVDGVRINGCAVDGVEEDPDVIRKRMFPSSSNGRPFSKRHRGITAPLSLRFVSEVEYLRNLVCEFQTYQGDLLVCRGCRSVNRARLIRVCSASTYDSHTTESYTDYCDTTLCKSCQAREAHNLSIAADVGGESGM
jgi:hypothetical protein